MLKGTVLILRGTVLEVSYYSGGQFLLRGTVLAQGDGS